MNHDEAALDGLEMGDPVLDPAIKRFVVISTWGEHHVLAVDDSEAEELAEGELEGQGYDQPEVMINDGMTEEWTKNHNDWHGE